LAVLSSEAVAILSSVGLKLTLFSELLRPVNVTKLLPCKSDNLAVLSFEAVAIASPVGLKQTLVTELLCPVNVTKQLPCKSHNLPVPSCEAVAILSPVGLKLTLFTEPLCPTNCYSSRILARIFCKTNRGLVRGYSESGGLSGIHFFKSSPHLIASRKASICFPSD
jgi:hypothetical protein